MPDPPVEYTVYLRKSGLGKIHVLFPIPFISNDKNSIELFQFIQDFIIKYIKMKKLVETCFYDRRNKHYWLIIAFVTDYVAVSSLPSA